MEACSASTVSFSCGQLGILSRVTSTFRAYSFRSAWYANGKPEIECKSAQIMDKSQEGSSLQYLFRHKRCCFMRDVDSAGLASGTLHRPAGTVQGETIYQIRILRIQNGDHPAA